jgi:ectoine hydroxylase-related dioxygenase (phytanoyl-CoA dioxygenase family)
MRGRVFQPQALATGGGNVCTERFYHQKRGHPISAGSHLLPRERKALPEEITLAEMSAGSALYYLGSAIHGGGANTTESESRRGLFLGYVVGWLRTERESVSHRSDRIS